MKTVDQPPGVTLVGAGLLLLAGAGVSSGVVTPDDPLLTAVGVVLLAYFIGVGIFLIRGKNWARRLYLWGFPVLYAAYFIPGFVLSPQVTARVLWRPWTLGHFIVFGFTAVYFNTPPIKAYFHCGGR